MTQAVVFDVDGVLIDSFAIVFKVRTGLLAQHGVDIREVPDPYGESHKGSSARKLLQALQQSHGVLVDEQQFKRDTIDGVKRDMERSGIEADPELIGFLEDLRAHNVPCAIATSGSRESTYNKLRLLGIEKYFQVIVTADDVEQHKPDPELYLTAMSKIGVSPKNCVVFEDSGIGAEAGKRSGAYVIGFTKYISTKAPVDNANITIDRWQDINYEKLSNLA